MKINSMLHPSSHILMRSDSVATIHPKWLPWLRAIWILIVFNAIAVFAWMVYLTRQFADSPAPRVAAGLSALGWTSDSYFWFHAAFMTVAFICFFVIGSLIFLLRPTERMAWFASIFLIAFGAASSFPLAPEFAAGWEAAPILFRVSYVINNIFAWPLIAAFFALFPDGRFVPKWSRYLAIYVFFSSFLFGIFPSTFGAPEGWLLVFLLISATLIIGGTLYAQVWRYRHYATPVQKQQTKWLIYALAVFGVFLLGFSVIAYVFFPTSRVDSATSVATDLILFATNMTLVLLPLSIGVAIVRYRLWDIDILIRKTLTYALVVALLAIVYFGSVILLQQLFASVTGLQDNTIITVISTLGIAALFVPLRNKIQDFIDRRFYRKKYDAQQVLQDFAQTVRDETDLEKLTARLIEVVNETMQPKSVSVWLKKEKADN